MDLNIGIVGLGFMGYTHVKDIIPAEEEFNVLGVYDIDPDRRQFARDLEIPAFETLEDLLAQQDLNTVVIATPNHLHKEQCIAALRAGKNVICEKPVMMNADELDEVLAVAKQANCLFTVHQNRRQDKDYRVLKEALAQDTVGTPVFIESRVQGANGVPSDWRCKKEYGGGMLLDWGVHLIDQMLMLVESPLVSVNAVLKGVNYKVDDNFKVSLQFANGVTAQIEVLTMCFLPLPRWHVLGTKGTLDIEGWEGTGEMVCGELNVADWSLDALKHAAGFTRTMQPRPEATVRRYELPKVEEKGLSFYHNFRQALQGKEELQVKPEQARRTMQVLDICFESSMQGKTIICHL